MVLAGGVVAVCMGRILRGFRTASEPPGTLAASAFRHGDAPRKTTLGAGGRQALLCGMCWWRGGELFEEILAALGLELGGKEWHLPPMPLSMLLRERPYQYLHAPLLVMLRSSERMAVIGGSAFVDNAHPQPTPLDQAPKKWRIEMSCPIKNWGGGAAVGSGRVTAGRK